MKPSSLRSTSLAVMTGLLLALLPTGAHADALTDLEAQIQRYQEQLAQINAQTISVDNQIADTRSRVARLQTVLGALNAQLLINNAHLSENQAQLDRLVVREGALTEQLNRTQFRMAERQASFASQVRVLDKVEFATPLSLLLTSHSFTQFMQRMTGIRQVADGTNQMAVQLRSDRDILATQQAELDRERAEQAKIVAGIEEERQTLEQEYAIQNSATLQLQALQSLLGQQEAQLVAQAGSVTGEIQTAEAEVAALLAFSQGQGGNIVPPEYLSNSWGNYYNQRDARWGNVYLGNTPYEVWEIGCLLSSVAMVNSPLRLPQRHPRGDRLQPHELHLRWPPLQLGPQRAGPPGDHQRQPQPGMDQLDPGGRRHRYRRHVHQPRRHPLRGAGRTERAQRLLDQRSLGRERHARVLPRVAGDRPDLRRDRVPVARPAPGTGFDPGRIASSQATAGDTPGSRLPATRYLLVSVVSDRQPSTPLESLAGVVSDLMRYSSAPRFSPRSTSSCSE